MKSGVMVLVLGAVLLVFGGHAVAAYHVAFDFETSWTGDYAPGWKNAAYRHGEAPVGKMMEQVSGGYTGNGMKLTVDSVPQSWMWWAAVDVIDVSAAAMQKQYDPWMSVRYYDEGSSPTDDDPAGQMFAVPSWTNNYIGGTEDWTDIQFGARFTQEDNYYFVAAGESSPGWVDTGVARPTVTPAWHHLKMQLSSADGMVHFYVDGVEKGTSYRNDYIDLGPEIGLYTMFNDPLSEWDPKPGTIWDDFEFGSSIPEPASVIVWSLLIGITWAGGAWRHFYRRRRQA